MTEPVTLPEPAPPAVEDEPTEHSDPFEGIPAELLAQCPAFTPPHRAVADERPGPRCGR